MKFIIEDWQESSWMRLTPAAVQTIVREEAGKLGIDPIEITKVIRRVVRTTRTGMQIITDFDYTDFWEYKAE